MPDPNLNSISPTQKLLQQYLIDAPVNVVKGLLGLDPQKDESKPGYWANFVGQLAGIAPAELLKAGLPFAAIKGSEPIFHGTGSIFEKFDPSKYDTSDTLGWMTHFAEDPDTADLWAQGNFKYAPLRRENIIPAKIDAKNVLDLSYSAHLGNMDDISQALASMPADIRNNIINNASQYAGTGWRWEQELKSGILRAYQDPEIFKRSPFDAIRYEDTGSKPAFAVPDTTPITTPWGLELNTPPKSLKVIRSEFGNPDNPGAKLAEDRWMHTPLNVKDEPPPLLSDAPKEYTNASKFNSGDTITLKSPFGNIKDFKINDKYTSNIDELLPGSVPILIDKYNYKLIQHIPAGGK